MAEEFRRLLEKSMDGLFYVEDEEDGMYEIEAFLGDVPPICQVFRANYFSAENTEFEYDSLGFRRRRGTGIYQDVALKLVRVDGSLEFMNMRQEIDNTFRISPNDDDDQENHNFITADHIILGIYKSFYYRDLLCVSMPYFIGGSLRSMINKMIPDRKLPEKCIAVVLRETLTGLCFLHGQERVHAKLNAGNIFVGPETMKLGYQGSTYFHSPEADHGTRIWDESWDPLLGGLLCEASRLEENKFWTIRGIYEPSCRADQQNYTRKSDIWNVGVTALELALGPFRSYRGHPLRNPDELRTFLTDLRNNEDIKLPRLFQLFIPDSGSRIAMQKSINEKDTVASTSSSTSPAATKIRKGKTVKNFLEKVKGKVLHRKPKSDPQEVIPKWPEIKLDFEDELSGSFTAMVKRCLVFDPEERPTAEELLTDPFFEEHQDADLQYLNSFILSHRPIPPPAVYF